MTDITNLDDIKVLVDSFYSSVRSDEKLGNIFDDVIGNRWNEHLEKMYRFWQTVLLEEHTYQGSPFRPHASLPVDQSHFEQWLHLFNKTVDDHFTGPNAERAKWQGHRMATMFLSKIEFYKNQPFAPLL